MIFIDVAKVVKLGDEHLALFNLGSFGIDDPLHVTVAHFGLQHGLAVAHTAQTQVADIRFAGDIGDGHLVAQLALTQVGIQDELMKTFEVKRMKWKPIMFEI